MTKAVWFNGEGYAFDLSEVIGIETWVDEEGCANGWDVVLRGGGRVHVSILDVSNRVNAATALGLIGVNTDEINFV